MRRIIAATDFSPAASNAVAYATEMAKAIGAELLLFNVYNIPVTYADGVVTLPVENLREESEEGLEKLKAQIVAQTGGKVAVSVYSRMGSILEELEELCRSKQPFAVVIGSRGKTNLETSIFGSAALSLIRQLTWPVICVPPGVTYGKGIRKIGLACDFRDVADTVPAVPIRDLLEAFHAELHILNVDYKEKGFRNSTAEDSFALHQLFNELNPQYHFIEDPDVEVGIYQFMREHSLDMLITIPKKHRFLERIFRKSKTGKLVHVTPAPLACIHA